MAVISPALVVALCVMFMLTRLATVRFTFEHLFFFGLRYCIEPTRAQMASLLVGSASDGARRKGAGAKPSVASLPVTRALVGPAFFATREEVPHLQAFGHLLSVMLGYAIGVLFEDMCTCLFPVFFRDSHVWWLAVFALALACVESLRVCFALGSRTAPVVVAAVTALGALAAVAAGNLPRLAAFEVARDAFTRATRTLLESRLQMPPVDATRAATRLALLMQISTAALAGALSAASLFPAARFARLDYAMVVSHRSPHTDPWALPPRRAFVFSLVAMDYILPAVALALWPVARASTPMLAFLILGALVRLLAARHRLQLHLDDAVGHFRAFWAERAVIGVVQAGDRLKYFVAHNAYTLTSVAMASIVNPVITIVLALTAKRNGGARIGVCPFGGDRLPSDAQIVVREVIGFLMWVSVASYLLFAAGTGAYLAVSNLFDKSATRLEKKTVRPMSNSERRKQRRNYQPVGTSS